MAFVKLADNYTDLIGKFAVALLAEGVDRNNFLNYNIRRMGSPSSRRAWIEIDVDKIADQQNTSPSSRRAWIEIR